MDRRLLSPAGRRRSLVIAWVACVALACAGCGASGHGASSGTNAADAGTAAPQAHPQAVEPVAGAAAPTDSARGSTAPRVASVSVSSPDDPSLARPASMTEIRRELTESGMTASPNQATLTSGLLAVSPVGAPAAVQDVISAGNQIAHLPYIWGGGHLTYEDTGYDCSGSLSYVLAAAGLLNGTMTSGELEHWGDPGPGKWITVFANAGHTFMYVAGLRFDTVALAETGSRWSDHSADEPDLSSFVERHPPGL